MDRSKYCNPDMPVGYIKKEPELRYADGIEINGVHYKWAVYIHDAHIEENENFATLGDLIMTSDEECMIEATVAPLEEDCSIAPCKIKKEKIDDDDDDIKKKSTKHTKKGHDNDTSALATSFSHLDCDNKGAKRKKKIKIKKERRRSSSSSSSSSHKHDSSSSHRHRSTSSHKHHSPPSHKHHSPPSHKHHSPPSHKHHSPPSHKHHSPPTHKHHSPPSSKHQSPSSHKHRSPSPMHRSVSSKRHYSPDKEEIYASSESPEHYMDVKIKQEHIKVDYIKSEYIKEEYFDMKVKQELPEGPPEHLHGCYHCDTCNITMNSLLTYNTHLNGKRHRKNLKVKNISEAVAASIPATVFSEDMSKYPKPPSGVIRRKVQKPAEIQGILETVIKQACPGLNFVTEIQGLSGVQYYCSLCDSVCSSNSVVAHLTGFKHQLKSVKQFKPGAYEDMQNEPKYKIEKEVKGILRAVQKKEGMGRMAVEIEEMTSDDTSYGPHPPRSYSSSIPSTSRGITREQSDMSFSQRYDKSTIPDMTASDFFCDICDSHMNSLQMWEAHIRGKRHLANLKKLPGDLPSKTKTVPVSNKTAYLIERIHIERPPGEPFIGLKEIRETEIKETNSLSYQCFLCRSCHTSIDIIEHLMSLKHRTKYLDHIDFPSREVISGMSDSMASNLVREMCIKVEENEGMGKPSLHVSKSSLQMHTYR